MKLYDIKYFIKDNKKNIFIISLLLIILTIILLIKPQSETKEIKSNEKIDPLTNEPYRTSHTDVGSKGPVRNALGFDKIRKKGISKNQFYFIYNTLVNHFLEGEVTMLRLDPNSIENVHNPKNNRPPFMRFKVFLNSDSKFYYVIFEKRKITHNLPDKLSIYNSKKKFIKSFERK